MGLFHDGLFRAAHDQGDVPIMEPMIERQFKNRSMNRLQLIDGLNQVLRRGARHVPVVFLVLNFTCQALRRPIEQDVQPVCPFE